MDYELYLRGVMMLQARSRLLAFSPNFLGKGGLETMLRKVVDKIDFETATPLGTHGVYSLGLQKTAQKTSIFFITLTKAPTAPIGFLEVEETWGFPAAIVSVIATKFQGQGLGRLLYETALKHFGTLASSNDLSKGSSALWRQLVTKYHGTLVLPKAWAPGKKDLALKIVGWDTNDKITFPVLETADGNMSLRHILDQTRAAGRAKSKGQEDLYNSHHAARACFYLVRI